jgi:hypothetical protein
MDEARQALAPMDFSTFVMSLATSAMVHLGEVPNPEDEPEGPGAGAAPHTDLDAAKQIIDILGVLEEKTRGNLDNAEDKLLRTLLYDLRVRYVDAERANAERDR